MNPQYLDIFFETARVASITPFTTDPTYFAMRAFGGFDMRLAFLMAAAGGTFGQVINFLIGRVLLALKVRGTVKFSDALYERSMALFRRYGIFLLFFCWVPVVNLLVVAAGFLSVRPRIVVPLVALGEAAHYGYYLL